MLLLPRRDWRRDTAKNVLAVIRDCNAIFQFVNFGFSIVGMIDVSIADTRSFLLAHKRKFTGTDGHG